MKAIILLSAFVCSTLLLQTAALAAEPPAPPSGAISGNLVQNGGFEHNWFNHEFANRRRFLLLQASDMGIAERDGSIDHWTLRGKSGAWDSTVAHGGLRSLRFDGPGSASQMIRFAGENSPRGGGAFYAYFMPMERKLAWQVLRRPIIVGAWCKTQNVPAGAEPKLSIKVDCGARQRADEFTPQITFGKKMVVRSVSAVGATNDWQYLQLRIEPADLEPAPWFATVTVSSAGKGTVWFDDISCVEPATPGLPNPAPQIGAPAGTEPAAVDLVNRLPNGGFESLDDAGWARGWMKPTLWTWFRNEYYTFTGWSHSDAKDFRGSAVVDHMISASGNASLRMTVFPGDNFAVASDPIQLNQQSPHPIEVRAMVKADNLRTLEIMARDERGAWLRQGDFLGDGMQEPGAYNMATTGAGTYDWVCVRKYFSPDRPVKSLSLFLAVRGFDGRIVEDKDIVGTVWIDDVQVFEHGGEPGKTPAPPVAPTEPPAPSAFPFKVVDIDLGDRLWGKNTVTLTIEYKGAHAYVPLILSLQLTLTDPQGKSTQTNGLVTVVHPPVGEDGVGIATIRAEYQITALCQNWQEQYKLSLRLLEAGNPAGLSADYFFGTPRNLLTAGVSGYYFYPGEKVFAYANINVSRDSLKDLARCVIVVRTGDKETVALNMTDLSKIGAPQTAPEYINTHNMVRAEIESTGFAVHPWTDAQRDNVVSVRLFGKADGNEKLIAESSAASFGFMEQLPPALPEKIERTGVNEKGFITVNGQPFFPVCWRPHGESKAPEADYPPHALKYKTLDLTSIVYSKDAAPDADVKKALLAKIEQVKNDPKFFQYEIGDGEMQLQGKEWTTHLEWCKTAIDWIREADPNHIINGPISWLVGHPGHNETMKSFIGYWDVIGVEASFESPVLTNKVAVPLMTKRKTAVIVGLEAYFYQPLKVLRWRGYQAVLDGAHGIGLCPSGMLESRPDKINYLRGLNAEFRALAPAIMGDEPAQKCAVDDDRVELMERTVDGQRILIAARGNDKAGTITAKFKFPPGISCTSVKALFEGRNIVPSKDSFSDEFSTPYTVHVYQLK